MFTVLQFKISYAYAFLFLLLSISYQSPAKTQLDSLLNVLQENKTYQEQVSTMILISRLYRESDAEKAIGFGKKTIDIAEKAKDTSNLVKIYEIYSHTLSVQGNYPLALRYLNKALGLLQNRHDNFSLAVKNHIQAYQINFEPLDEHTFFSKKHGYFNTAIHYQLKSNDRLGLADSYFGLAQSFLHQADIPKQNIKYGPGKEKNQAYADQINASELYDKAYQYYIKAYYAYQSANMKDRMAGSLAEMARLKLILRDFQSASILLDSAIQIHHRENGLIGEGKCYMIYSAMAKQQNNMAQAFIYDQKALEMFRKTNYNIEIAMVLKNIAKFHEEQNNYKKALEYHNQAYKYQENSYNENRTNSLLEIQNSYEIQLKNSRIQQLESEQKLAVLEKKEARNYMIGGALLLIIFLVSGIILYLFKERSLKQARKNIELTNLLNSSLTQKVNDAELTAMRAEMNPHFVFNTMSSIQGLIIGNRQSEAITYLNDFSRLSRRILDHSRSKYIRFSEELAFLNNYLALESLRFENRFQIKWDIDKNITQNELEIPPMLIQPFLENAIKHGLLPKKEKGQLSIRFINKPEDSVLYCEITDNGVGRTNTEAPDKEHKSKGIAITEKRLELLNGHENDSQPYTINIIDLKNKEGLPSGTQVQLFISYN